jgi:hypothetical protein
MRCCRASRNCDTSARADRPPFPTTLFVLPADPATLARYEQAGVHRAVYPLPAHADGDAMERELDRLAAVKDTYEHHAHTIQA